LNGRVFREQVRFYYNLAVREVEEVERGHVKIVIVHRYGAKVLDRWFEGRCITGEEVASAWIIFRGNSHRLPLGTPHLLLFDYICRHCRGFGQNAAEIEAGLNEKPWYVQHASSAKRRRAVISRSSRTNIRKQIERIREAMADLFAKEHLP